MGSYVDMHAHLTARYFAEPAQAILRASAAGLGGIVVNGLEPESNRQILQMSVDHPDIVFPALGIYPIDAVNDMLPADFSLRVGRFAVDAEIAFIRDLARGGQIAAVGECGLDGHWLTEETFARQEAVFLQLVEIAHENRLPVIVHTRKLERRALELLAHPGASLVDLHCYGGPVKLALAAAEKHGWLFSIPANSRRSQSFAQMLQRLPPESLMTETDCPFMSPIRGGNSEPADVVQTIAHLAELRGWSVEEARATVWANFTRMFSVAIEGRAGRTP